MSSTTLYYQEDVNKSILKAIRVCSQKQKQELDPHDNLRTLSAYEDLLRIMGFFQAVFVYCREHKGCIGAV